MKWTVLSGQLVWQRGRIMTPITCINEQQYWLWANGTNGNWNTFFTSLEAGSRSELLLERNQGTARWGVIIAINLFTIFNRNYTKFWTPPKGQGVQQEKILWGDTTRACFQAMYRWTADCSHPCQLEVADKTRTDGRTDRLQTMCNS